MAVPMKFYAVSLLAFQQSDDLLDSSKQMMYWEHSPLILSHASIDDAISNTKIIAFERWKKEDGWSKHSASIVPIDRDFVFGYLGLIREGVIEFDADAPEDRRFVVFDDDDPMSEIQGSGLLDSH